METTWMAKGNCADRDPKIFFPSDGIGAVSYTHLTLPTTMWV